MANTIKHNDKRLLTKKVGIVFFKENKNGRVIKN